MPKSRPTVPKISENCGKMHSEVTKMEVYGRITSQVAPESVQGRYKAVKRTSAPKRASLAKKVVQRFHFGNHVESEIKSEIDANIDAQIDAPRAWKSCFSM